MKTPLSTTNSSSSRGLIRLLLILSLSLAAALAGVGCRQLDGYKRTYSLNYVTPQGQPVGVGVTLDPVKRAGK
ncbi:hypothetical protein [Verrucomicrobium sp. BvORR106]|uniref:hypothetical protein n=1 Tax=Verrucomicrobium sp. BvORR106 TaxID=1403819 RepID=UPI00056DAC0A|nr:hypothetical protein [Verrucomicrobium sp. BvORR106]